MADYLDEVFDGQKLSSKEAEIRTRDKMVLANYEPVNIQTLFQNCTANVSFLFNKEKKSHATILFVEAV